MTSDRNLAFIKTFPLFRKVKHSAIFSLKMFVRRPPSIEIATNSIIKSIPNISNLMIQFYTEITVEE